MLKVHPFVAYYSTNLFILLEFFLILLRVFSFIPGVNNFRTILSINFGYLVILFPVIVLVIYYEVMILRNNDEFYKISKNNWNIKILVVCLLVLQVVGEYIFFQIGIIEIIGDQFPEIISDPNTYEKWTSFGYIAGYMMIPVINYRSLVRFKNSLGVKSELDHNRFKIDILPAALYMCIGFIISLVGVTVYNYSMGFLKL